MGITIYAETVRDYAELEIVNFLIHKPGEERYDAIFDFFRKIQCQVIIENGTVTVQDFFSKKAVMILNHGKIEYTADSEEFFKEANKFLFLFRAI